MRVRKKGIAGLGVLALLAVGLAAWTLGRQGGNGDDVLPNEGFHGFVLEPPHPAPDFTLTDQHRRPYRLEDQQGQAVVLFFGYTNCPDVCPATLIYYSHVKRELGDLADRVEFVFVTVDPDYDTPERLREYVARFDPAFYGLSGTWDQLAPVIEDYGVYVEVAEDSRSPVGYWVNHTALSYVIDPQGRLRLAHPFGVEPEKIAADLRRLL